MDKMLFSPEENAARRKFHELFCTKYLHTGTKKGALNADSWNANILWDILRHVQGQTILTPDDIETILQIGGMYDQAGELYFHFSEQTPMSKTILSAISPYISTNAFVRGNQELQGRVMNSVASFYKACCCNLEVSSEKRYCNDVYDAYREWCTINGLLVLSNRTFSKKMRECGCPPKKGYLDKKCGVMYYQIRLDVKEVTNIVKQTGTSQTNEEKGDSDNGRAKDQIVAEASNRTEEEVYTEAEDIITGSLRGFDDDVQNDAELTADEYGDPEDADEDGDPRDADSFDEDGFDWGTGEYSTAVDRPVSGGGQNGSKGLKPEIKRVFRQLKITYRVAPEHFTREDFNKALQDEGILPADEIFGEFLKYVL